MEIDQIKEMVRLEHIANSLMQISGHFMSTEPHEKKSRNSLVIDHIEIGIHETVQCAMVQQVKIYI